LAAKIKYYYSNCKKNEPHRVWGGILAAFIAFLRLLAAAFFAALQYAGQFTRKKAGHHSGSPHVQTNK
jgi:hypothetical protein